MQLITTVPQEWVAISNGRETRYENANKEGMKILEKYNLEWFLKFYGD